MSITTIKINRKTKGILDRYREYKNESYDDILKKLLFIIKNIKKPISSKVLKGIEDSRNRGFKYD